MSAPYHQDCAAGESVSVPISAGSTGIMSPMPSTSMKTVVRMKGRLALRDLALRGMGGSLSCFWPEQVLVRSGFCQAKTGGAGCQISGEAGSVGRPAAVGGGGHFLGKRGQAAPVFGRGGSGQTVCRPYMEAGFQAAQSLRRGKLPR